MAGKNRAALLALLLLWSAATLGANATVHVDWPSEAQSTEPWPVSAGVPFGRDAAPDLGRARLVDEEVREIPAQWRVLQRWHPEGTPRWVSVDFQAPPGMQRCRFETVGGSGPAKAGIVVKDAGTVLVVDTGALRAEIPKRGAPGLFTKAWVKGRPVCETGRTDGAFLVNQHGVRFLAAADPDARTTVERSGPVHTVIRIDGTYGGGAGQRLGAYVARLHFYAARPFIRLQHTFLFTESGEKLQIRDLGVRVTRPGERAPTAAFDADSKPDSRSIPVSMTEVESAWLVQDVYHHLGQPESHWGLYAKSAAGIREAASGKQAGNWVSLRGGGPTMTAVLKNFWQEFPKELETDGRSVTAHFWSRRGDPLDFRTSAFLKFWGGEKLNEQWRSDKGFFITDLLSGKARGDAQGLAKTHEVLFDFGQGDGRPAEVAGSFSEPPLAYPDPTWTAKTDVAGLLSPRDPKRFPEYEQALDVIREETHRFVRDWGNYGWWEHGAGPHMAYTIDKQGRPIGRPWRYTGGVEYWYTRALWKAYLRSGQRGWFDLVAPRARHFMDVVFSHMDTPTRWRGSFFWTAAGPPVHWGGSNRNIWGEKEELPQTPRGYMLHQFGWTVDTFLYYYYLTGDDRAWDVVLEYADFMKRRFDYDTWVDDLLNPDSMNIMKSRMAFSILDELSILHEATGDAWFRERAGQLARRVLLPAVPGGIHREVWPPRSGRIHPAPYALYYKTPCVVRYWRATGDPLARDAIRQMVEYDYEAEHWGAYAAGVRYAWGWILGGPVSYLGCGKHTAWRVWHTSRMAAEETPYKIQHKALTLATSGILSSFNALMAAERKLGRPIPAFPTLPRPPQAADAEIMVLKEPGREARLEIRTGAAPLRIEPEGAEIASRDYHPKDGRPHQYITGCVFHEVRLPKSAPVGPYRIQAPARTEVIVLTATGTKIMLHAPHGFPINAEIKSGRWFFRVPAGAEAFEVTCADPGLVSVISPTGRRIAMQNGSLSCRVEAQPGEKDDLWSLSAADRTYVKVEGIRPAFAFRDKEQMFPVDTVVPVAEADDDAAKRERYVAGVTGKAVRIGRREYLQIDLGRELANGSRERLRMDEGTIEFWFLTDWPYFFVPEGETRTLFTVNQNRRNHGAFTLQYLKDIRSRGTIYDLRMNLSGEKGRLFNGARKNTWWMPGEWNHLAVQWGRKKGAFVLEIFYNGEDAGYANPKRLTAQMRSFRPIAVGDHLCIGGPNRGTFTGAFDELRVSKVRRYGGEGAELFRRLEPDEHTLMLFHFDGDTGSAAEPGGPARASVRKR